MQQQSVRLESDQEALRGDESSRGGLNVRTETQISLPRSTNDIKMDNNRTYFVHEHGSDTDAQKNLPREKDTYMELVGSRDKSLVS